MCHYSLTTSQEAIRRLFVVDGELTERSAFRLSNTRQDRNMSDDVILNICRRNYHRARQHADDFPDLGNRWGVFAKQMEAAINGFQTLQQAIDHGQAACDFDHRGIVGAADMHEIAITKHLLKYTYPSLAADIERFSDSPRSRAGYVLPTIDADGTTLYLNKIIYFHAMYLLTTFSHLGEINTVCEIGGGSGGPCYHFLTNGFSKTQRYCIVDLPESLFFAEAFLRASLPDAEFVYVDADQEPIPELGSAKQVVLVPIAARHKLASLPIDLMTNTGSMAEMTDEWLSFWSDWIDRQQCRAFYSSNYFGNPIDRIYEGRSTLAPRVSQSWQPALIRSLPIMMMLQSFERRLAEIIFTRHNVASDDQVRAQSFISFDGLPLDHNRYIYALYFFLRNIETHLTDAIAFIGRVETAFGYTPVEVLFLTKAVVASAAFSTLQDPQAAAILKRLADLKAAFSTNYPSGVHID